MTAARRKPRFCASCAHFVPAYTRAGSICTTFGVARGATARACKQFSDRRAEQLELPLNERTDHAHH